MYPKLARLSSLSIQPAINLYLVDSFLPLILFPCIKTPNWPLGSIIRGSMRQKLKKIWLYKRRKEKNKTTSNISYINRHSIAKIIRLKILISIQIHTQSPITRDLVIPAQRRRKNTAIFIGRRVKDSSQAIQFRVWEQISEGEREGGRGLKLKLKKKN